MKPLIMERKVFDDM